MDFDEILMETHEGMENALKHTLAEFQKLHTGKATPAMVDGLQVYVESYGSAMPIRELGAVTTPDSRTIQIQPWDRTALVPIEKTIRSANLGLNPSVRGTVIFVPVPELSGDRRKELVRVASAQAEEGRVGIRKARQQAMERLKELKAEGHTSEDDIKRFEKEIQEETDAHVERINEALKNKEADLLKV